MTQDQGDAPVALAKETVRRVAPAEIPLFTAIAGAYAAHALPGGKRNRDDVLGFGMAEAAVLVTPVVLDLVHRLWDAIADDLASEGTGLAREVLGRLRARFGHGAVRPDAPQLTHEQLAYVRAVGERTVERLTAQQGAVAVDPHVVLDAVLGAVAVPASP